MGNRDTGHRPVSTTSLTFSRLTAKNSPRSFTRKPPNLPWMTCSASTQCEAGVRHGLDVRFLVECDTGFGRTGVQTPEAAFELARTVARLPRMQFSGLMTFPNREPTTREFFTQALGLFKGAGIPVPVVSGGGTPGIFTAQNFPMLTEHRAGTCVFNDVMVVSSGTATWDNCAMRVRATVVSRPTDGRAILDAGTKVLTSDQYGQKGFGHVMEYPEAVVAKK